MRTTHKHYPPLDRTIYIPILLYPWNVTFSPFLCIRAFPYVILQLTSGWMSQSEQKNNVISFLTTSFYLSRYLFLLVTVRKWKAVIMPKLWTLCPSAWFRLLFQAVTNDFGTALHLTALVPLSVRRELCPINRVVQRMLRVQSSYKMYNTEMHERVSRHTHVPHTLIIITDFLIMFSWV
jgi:hypothetical protein